jgi:hypothetical protein
MNIYGRRRDDGDTRSGNVVMVTYTWLGDGKDLVMVLNLLHMIIRGLKIWFVFWLQCSTDMVGRRLKMWQWLYMYTLLGES